MESVIFLASLVIRKAGIVCLTLSKKRTGKAALVVAFFNSCRLLAGGIFVWVLTGLADHVGLR